MDLGQLALRSEPSARVLDEAVHRLARTLAVDYAKVLELRTDGKSFLLRAGRGWKPGIVGNAIAPLESDSQAEFTLRSKQPVIMEDLQTETRFQDVMMFGEPIVASGMSVEISTSLGPYGVLAVHSRQRRKFSQDEVNFLQSVANILSTIVERTRAETILRESEAAFHTLADTVPQMVWMCMPDGLNIYFNQQWVDYTGLSLEESYGKGWNPPFHLADKQKAWDAGNHATRTGEKYRVESRLRAADGSYRWFLMRGEPMRDAKANIVKWFGSCTDIEDMKHVEESLRRLNEQFQQADTYNRSLLEASLDPRVQQTSKNAAKRRAEVISPSGGPKRVDRVLQPSRGDRSPRGRASVS